VIARVSARAGGPPGPNRSRSPCAIPRTLRQPARPSGWPHEALLPLRINLGLCLRRPHGQLCGRRRRKSAWPQPCRGPDDARG
jgi:hypothetical protein